MFPRFTVCAKLFLIILFGGGFMLIALVAYMLTPSASSTQHFRKDLPVKLNCDQHDFIFEGNGEEAKERIQQLRKRHYDHYCLKQVGERQWDVYAK
ncbi:hypothetical protein AGJ18_06350 [Cronobacter sakazakii]|nr:hypothetical protein [Cronobacter sakazakii]NCH90700.1 hypothetical protein [Cronobacter sakazakii]PPY08786.1 hypothetical protein C3D82_17300 [Cronobacter sakazakii]PQV70282.1 hypothetical protein CDT97_04010 [Cronobacter sakazakii]PQV89471.1 hypothetical protein CDT87_05760 [Cronobacter sakazakii]